jgi:hypothetical protein
MLPKETCEQDELDSSSVSDDSLRIDPLCTRSRDRLFLISWLLLDDFIFELTLIVDAMGALLLFRFDFLCFGVQVKNNIGTVEKSQ